MKYKRNIYAALLALFTMGMTACTDNDENWQAGEPENENCQGVYFPSQTSSFSLDPEEETTLTFTAMRAKYDEAITVPVEVTESEEDIFTISAIEFAEGQTETTFTVSFPNAELGKTYTCEIAVTDNAYATIYGAETKNLNIEVTRVAWLDVDADKSIVYNGQTYTGYEWYTDDIITTIYTVDNQTYPVKVQVRGDTVDEDYPNGPNGLAGIYRMVNPYGALYPYNEPGDYTEDTYVVINAENVNEVYIDYQPMGINWGYGDMYIYSLAAYYVANGYSGDDYFGKIENGAITFPTSALLTSMSNYESGALYYANTNGAFRLVICQDQEVDYSLLLSSSETANGSIDITATLGSDVATVKYATFEGALSETQVSEYSAGMEAGTYPTQSITTSGTLSLTFEATGKYTLVANIYDASGTLQGYQSISFGYITANDDVPVVLTGKLELTSQYEALGITRENSMRAIIYGEDIESGYFGLYPTLDVPSSNLDTFVQQTGSAFTDTQLESVNGSGLSLMATGLNSGMSYTLVVWAFNGYISKVFTAELTTEGTLDPIYVFYTPADLTDYSKDEWLKSWDLYAVDYFEDTMLRSSMGQAVITDDTTNDTATEDYINIRLTELDALLQNNIGLRALYDSGYVYLLSEGYTGTYYNYYIVPRFLCQENSYIISAPYAMVGGKVAEGIIAFVPNPSYISMGYTFYCYYLAAFSSYDDKTDTYSGFAGGLMGMGWPLLVEPSTASVDAATINMLGKALTYQPTNCVELRGLDRARAMLRERQTLNFAKNNTIAEKEVPAGAAVESKATFTPGVTAKSNVRILKKDKADQSGIKL